MGYRLWVMPLCEGEDPAERMRELVARAETGGSTPRQEARKQRLTELLISLEPRLGVFRRDPHALAEALPDLTEGQIAYLARTVELTGRA